MAFKIRLIFIEAVNKIDGYEVNREYLNAEVEAVKKHLFSLKRKFLFYKETKECAIFGDYDTVLGFDAILKELGLATDRFRSIVPNGSRSRLDIWSP